MLAHRKGALAIVSVDPISLGLLRRPGGYGADIVVAEGQGLGNPLAFGGPYLGIMACREEYVRKMPGRIVGQTTDRHGKRCWVLTLQTREQHIRREKATSNICTNQGLLALRASIYLAAVGPGGLRQAAELSTRKAHYAAERLAGVDGLSLAFAGPFFKEFVIRSEKDPTASSPRSVGSAITAGSPSGVGIPTWPTASSSPSPRSGPGPRSTAWPRPMQRPSGRSDGAVGRDQGILAAPDRSIGCQARARPAGRVHHTP